MKQYILGIEATLEIFGGKWKARIICVLSSEEFMRYNELKKILGNITDAVLSEMLRELIENDMVDRNQYNEIPPRVEYSLTETGQSIEPVLKALCNWGKEYLKSIT